MTRLYIAAEGTTEVAFISQLLEPYLMGLSEGKLTVRAPNLRGYQTYAKTKKFLQQLLMGGGSLVTTMIDLHKLPADFPGRRSSEPDPVRRVQEVSRQVELDFSDGRYLPYFQLHEFEALLLSDAAKLVERHPGRKREIEELGRQVRRYPSPEHVNHLQPPSHRIQAAVPEYDKSVDGVIVAEAIGLEKMRGRCTHFGEWLGRLERLAHESRQGAAKW